MDILEMAAMLARTTYTNKFCSVCGKAITLEEVNKESRKDGKVFCLAHQESLSTERTEGKTLNFIHKKEE